MIVACTSSEEDFADATAGVAAITPFGLLGLAATSLSGPADAEDAKEDFVPCRQPQASQESLSWTRQKRRAQVGMKPVSGLL